MMKLKAAINMTFYKYRKAISFIFVFLFLIGHSLQGQNRDNLPAEFREYTNPEEIVTFDRTTSFARALDVINEFAQKYRDKVVINRTGVSGDIDISVPAMHWMDALKLILRVKELKLVEQQDIYEIVTLASLQPQAQTKTSGNGATAQGEGPIATTQTHEVRINAIFFEGNRRALQEIGVDWSTISENVPDAILGSGQGGQGGGGQQGGQQGPSLPNSQFDGPFVQVNSKGAQSVSQDVFNALVNVGEIGNTGIEVQALFSAFEADNLGEILASPTIKVMDGEDGRIQVGQDFSIKQRDIAGNVIEDFFSVGTILEVTPQVIEQNDTTFVHLDINAERSTAQPDPVSTIINKQQAETQALLLDGEATVIAGLYNTEQSEVRRGVPILKDLPPWFFGLRYLFGYTSKDYQMRELVILLQASLEPTIPDRYDKDFRNKYEVLRDERDRMSDEIEEGEEIMQGKDPEDKKMNSEQQSAAPNTSEESENLAANQPQEMEEQNKEEDSTDSSEVNHQEEQQEQDNTMMDPEVEAKEIQLDLGSDSSSAMDSDTTREMESTQTDQASEEPSEPVANTNASTKYYLIAASFKVEENATDYRDKLQQEGFNSLILNKEDSEIMFVAYKGYQQLEPAKSGLADIQQNKNSDAWLYIQD